MSEQIKQPGDFADCPHWGKGGRYVIDLNNGQRVPVTPEIAANQEEAKGVSVDEAPAAAVKPAKGVKHGS